MHPYRKMVQLSLYAIVFMQIIKYTQQDSMWCRRKKRLIWQNKLGEDISSKKGRPNSNGIHDYSHQTPLVIYYALQKLSRGQGEGGAVVVLPKCYTW